MLRNRSFIIVIVAWFVSLAALVEGGIVIEDKPVSLLSRQVVMVQGIPCIPLADFAEALGGTVRTDLQNRLIVITPGSGGSLKLNDGPTGTFSPALMQKKMKPTEVAGGQAKASQNTAMLQLGGNKMSIEEYERIMLRPNPMMPLPLLGKLLGGQARLDPKKNQWLLPGGSAASQLNFG
jgi:hypothetical protein